MFAQYTDSTINLLVFAVEVISNRPTAAAIGPFFLSGFNSPIANGAFPPAPSHPTNAPFYLTTNSSQNATLTITLTHCQTKMNLNIPSNWLPSHDASVFPLSVEEWESEASSNFGFNHATNTIKQDVPPPQPAPASAFMGLGFDPFGPFPSQAEPYASIDPSVPPPFDDDIFGSKDIHPPHSNSGGHDDDWVGVTNEDDTPRQRKPCAPNLFEYEFGDVFDANWYRTFLRHDVREKTYILSSRDRFGEFRSIFRVPLTKVDELL